VDAIQGSPVLIRIFHQLLFIFGELIYEIGEINKATEEKEMILFYE
jgi:hypothetical protein